jgi:putative alpha-1,2-mannosidase
VAGFVVGSPVFPKATIHLESGKSIQIVGEHATRANCYVQSMKINGQPHESPWIPWSMLSDGAVVDFDLGEKPSRWGTDPGKAPPSFDKFAP